MHREHHSRTHFRATAALLVSVLSLCVSPGYAKSKDQKEHNLKPHVTAVGIYLIGHLALPETTVSRITTASGPRGELLQLTDTLAGKLTLVDVTEPDRPKLVEQSKLPGELAHANVQVQIGDTALLSLPQSDSPGTVDPQAVALVSFVDPINPKTLQTFEGVTAVASDGERELIYLSNADGLWVLKVYSTADKRAEEEFDEMIRSASSGG